MGNKCIDPVTFLVYENITCKHESRANQELEALEEEMLQMQESTHLFEVALPEYKQMKQCRKEIKLLKGLWDVIIYVQRSIDNWTKTQWRQINVEQMDVELRRFAKASSITVYFNNSSSSAPPPSLFANLEIWSLDKEVRVWDAYTGLEGTVKDMTASLRAITELQSPALRDRHWHQLMKAIGVKFLINEATTLADLLALQLHSVEDDVRRIVDKAVKELGTEKSNLHNYYIGLIFSAGRVRFVYFWDYPKLTLYFSPIHT
ncbi:Dynein heavy chain 11, axonemal [Saguinus oedipus]|uniref:Dynein heavy chain 11, axonemal n=1 Tax=Saguinus oedipus TaxID=9490 RepID=A0ABQ9UGM0_SAGOE|nr:Dynein heavy chain 11, axonemal [Saguinus oedipus]